MSPSPDDLSRPRRNLAGPSDVDGFGMHGDPGLDDDVHLAAFRDELRAFADQPAPAMRQDLARFVAGLGGLTEPVPEASRRKRPMILQTLTAKVVAGGVAAFAMFSGLAVAGALPDGVQSAVSSAGDSVGVGFPHPEDHQALAGDVQTETDDSSSSSTEATSASSETDATTASSETEATTASTEASSTESTADEATTTTGAEHETAAPDETPITGSETPTTGGAPAAVPNCRSLLPPGTTVVDHQLSPPAASPAVQAAYDAFLQCEATHQGPGNSGPSSTEGTRGETESSEDHGGERTTTESGDDHGGDSGTTGSTERSTGERTTTTRSGGDTSTTSRDGSNTGRR
jgi:hypothetical protein